MGINIVLVPVYYRNGGFDVPATVEQRRFIFSDVQDYLDLVRRLDERWSGHPYVKIGKGVHSLRAASRDDIPSHRTATIARVWCWTRDASQL